MAELKIFTTERPNTLCGTWNTETVTDSNGSHAPYTLFQTSAVELKTGELTIKNDFKDEHTIILMQGAGTVRVKAGNGYASANDLVITAPANTSFFTLDSSRYADVKTGEITIVAQTTQVGVLAPRV